MVLHDEASRMQVLHATKLLDSAPEEAFDRVTRLSASLIGAPVALVSLVDERRQFFKSALGLKEPWASRRETPLTHSFCQYATRDRAPLIVDDAREHPVLRDNHAIRDLNVIAYAGMPLLVDDEAIGALCVVDDKPRHWSKSEMAILHDLAECVVSEVELRLALRAARDQRALTDALVDAMGDSVLAVNIDRRFVLANKAVKKIFEGAEVGTIAPANWSALHRSQREDGTPMPAEDGAIQRALRGENTDGLVFTMQGPNATAPVWVEASGRPVRDADGKIVAAVGVYRDVTERKRRADSYAALAGNIPRGAVILFDHDLRLIAIDGGMLRDRQVPSGPLVGKTIRDIAGYAIGDAPFDRYDAMLRKALEGESSTADFTPDDRTVSLHCAPVRDGLGRITSGIILALDVTDERALDVKHRRDEQVYRAMLQHLPNAAVFLVDRELRYVAADGAIVAGLPRKGGLGSVLGKRVDEVNERDGERDVLDEYERTLAGERRHIEIERGGRFFDVDTVPIYEGDQVSHALVFLYDVSTRKAELAELKAARAVLETSAEELRKLSDTDDLTGLLNRRGFMLFAERDIKIASRNGRRMVLVFVDLNGMKTINDTLGHDVGDRALVDTATLLRKVFRESDVIGRLGGDEFVVLASDAADVERDPLAARLRVAVDAYNATSADFTLSLSLGTAVFDPATPAPLEDLLAEADERMYAEKSARHRLSSPRIKVR